MRGVLIVLLIAFVVQIPATVLAAHKEVKPWSRLGELSYKALELTKAQRYADAKGVLGYLEKEYLELSEEQKKLSIHQLRVFTTSFDESVKVLTSVSAPHEKRVDVLTEFHLLVDAVYTHHQPLWKSTRGSLMKPLEDMKIAATNQEIQAFYAHFNQFLSEYQKIHPALSIDLSEDTLNKLDSFITYLDENRSLIVTSDHQLQQINAIKAGLTDAFNQGQQDSSDPSLVWLILVVGGVILSTLFYVGWKKYKGEKREIHTLSKKKEYKRFR